MQNEIEQMAKAVCHLDRTCDECMTSFECKAMMYAKRFYEAGYRKTSDIASEIFEEIDDFQRTLRHIFLDMCGGNDYNTLNLLQIDSAIEALFDSRIAELKKKYTQEK
jgi:hypothetical protein